MLKQLNASSLLFIFSIAISTQASANLILEEYSTDTATPTTLGGYTLEDFSISNISGGNATSVDSPINGTLDFIDKNGNTVVMSLDSASDYSDWWNNGELFDYDIYTTSLNLITILLPENTRAFSFNVGADLGTTSSNNAWLRATESDGSGISKYRFNVTETNTPGFGIYTNNSNGNCSALTSVTIDPLLWGFGNFSINQDQCGSVSVPAPAPVALLALGLFGLGAMRKVKK